MFGKVSGGWEVWLQLEEELEVLFGICDMFFFFFSWNVESFVMSFVV